MSVKIAVLGSSSQGNSSLIWNNDSAILIDCGFGINDTKERLSKLGFSIGMLKGAVITHAHRDHYNFFTVKHLLNENIRIFFHKNISVPLAQNLKIRGAALNLTKRIDGEPVRIGSFSVRAFEAPHDSEGGCFGFIFFSNNIKISYMTDAGHHSPGLEDNFIDSDAIIIESNHDLEMLRNSERHDWLKNRISGDYGHLSNDQCASLLLGILKKSKKLPKTIMLAHISPECNSEDLALNTIKNALDENDYSSISVEAALKDNISKVIDI